MNSRSRFHRTIQRKDSPGPKVKQTYICGARVFLATGVKFRCYDRSDGYWKNCFSIGNGNYKCYDATNGKWEWPNWNERDFTPDNSHLTSIATDGRLYTSPSFGVQGDHLSHTPSVLDAGTSVYSRDGFDVGRDASYCDDDNKVDLALSN